MRIDICIQETKEIIKALKKDGKDFTADRFQKLLNREQGKKKVGRMSNELASYVKVGSNSARNQ